MTLGIRLTFLIIIFSLLIQCSTVPVTGRKQLNLVPAQTMLNMSFQEYKTFIQEHPISKNPRQVAMVKRVGNKIRKAVEAYFAEKKISHHLDGYQWEFNLIESNEVNAWCMPGGKVVVYTGILPVTRNEDGLAVVLGHEIAHAVAEHGNERMSQGLLTQLGGMALAKALEQKPEQTQQLWMAAFGLGAQFGVLLPFSRQQESEADKLGLIFMAMAGYNPQHAIAFWQRMAQNSGGNRIPEFMSTHPSDKTRIQTLQKFLPEAMKYYKR